MVTNRIIIVLVFASLSIVSCKTESGSQFTGAQGEVKIITLDPGHFHAALVQKVQFPQINPDVHIYAPDGNDVNLHINRINAFNNRAIDPTSWNIIEYRGSDFFEQMISERKGNVVMTAGNNRLKTEYIKRSIEAGLNVFSDKPMVINTQNFELLREAFKTAENNGVLLYDVMTERSGITFILQSEFSKLQEVFGSLEQGTPENPAVYKESVHHFYKQVSGVPLIRPPWFYDVEQQGEGIVDVTTHLVDLVQWGLFPGVILDYTKDVNVYSARRWATDLNIDQFERSTGISEFPQYLMKDVHDDILRVYSNGEINYTLKGVHVKVVVVWNYVAPEGGDDTRYSIIRGSNANLIIRQGEEQNFVPTLYIQPVEGVDFEAFETALNDNFKQLQDKYHGIGLKKLDTEWEVLVPQSLHIGHEAHFGEVTERFLQYLIDGKLPEWEVPNILAKYYTTTKALELAKSNQ